MATNKKEFKTLKKRYKSITLEEIKKEPFKKYFTAQKLTGHGDTRKCILCIAALKSGSCALNCVYGETGCMGGVNANTYYRISTADTFLKLLNAYHARAKHMGTIL